jgi:succinate dehydrogenase/fumarate reductase-like Fe-S protein
MASTMELEMVAEAAMVPVVGEDMRMWRCMSMGCIARACPGHVHSPRRSHSYDHRNDG